MAGAVSETIKPKSKKNPGGGRISDAIFRRFTASCAGFIVLLMVSICVMLAYHSTESFKTFGLSFLWSDAWNPVAEKFGAADSIFGTLTSTLIAMLLAVPLSLAVAMYLVELSHPFVSKIVGTATELLAAIPSIIYGMWGLFVFAPLLQEYVQPFFVNRLYKWPKEHWGIELGLFEGPPMGIGMMTAGLILALMILPFITAVSRDVLKMIPPVLKESTRGMGATVWESTVVNLRYGIKGIVGASFLGLGRAIGETMAVTFVIGNRHQISASLMAPGNTIASTLASEFGEAVSDPLFKSVLIELALVLFLMSFLTQIAAQIWVKWLQRAVGGGRIG